MFASSPLSRVGADECRPMTFENGGICRKMRRYHLFLPRSNVAGSTAIPLMLGLARPSYPTRNLSAWMEHLPIPRDVRHEIS